jgi:hypothetical protein
MALPDDAPDPPDAAMVMLNTRLLNKWLGTTYTLEEVAEMDPLTFEVRAALAVALDPPKGKQ